MEQTRDGAGRASAREEFAAAVTEHSHGMFRAARSILDSDADAEDAVGEAVLRAWQSWDRLRAWGAVRAWLLKIAVNCAYEQRRRDSGAPRRPVGCGAPSAGGAAGRRDPLLL